MTDESWFDSRQGQGVVSALQNVHTNCAAHSASLQRVPRIFPDGTTPHHSPPSTVDLYLYSPPYVQMARKGETLYFRVQAQAALTKSQSVRLFSCQTSHILTKVWLQCCGKQETMGICTVGVRKYRPGLAFVLQTLSGKVSLRPRTTTTQCLKPQWSLYVPPV